MMDKHIKKHWLDALRGGQYKQGTGYLCVDSGISLKYCCLGVLCDVVSKVDGCSSLLTQSPDTPRHFVTPMHHGRYLGDRDILNRVGLSYDEMRTLAFMNDADHNFKQIAAYIEDAL